MSSSPWSRTGAPSVTLPPPAPIPPPLPSPASGPTSPHAGTPLPAAFPPGRKPRRPGWLLVGLGLPVAIVLAAGTGSMVTFAAIHNNTPAQSSPTRAATPSAPPAPQFSAAAAVAAKQNLCHIVDLSVGQKSEGGFRVQGNLNVPVTLKAVNSVLAVQNALVPAVPPDVAVAARRYISTTLDVTTAAMGTVPASEINRLTDISNDAMYALVDACGLPR